MTLLTKKRGQEQRVIRPEPPRPHRQHVEVAQEDHGQDREEDDRIDHPGRAEEQGHVHDALGLEQHESRPRKNMRPLGRARRTGANANRMTSESTATIAMPRRLRAGIVGSRR